MTIKTIKTLLKILLFLIIWVISNSTLVNASSWDFWQLWWNTDNLVDRSRNWMFADSVKQIRQFSVWLPRWSTWAKLWNDWYPTEDFGWVIMTAQKMKYRLNISWNNDIKKRI